MSHARVSVLTGVSMMAFAGNSLLCRLALKSTSIDPASFASI
ncbi:MAG: EamA family transporter, partial [Rhodoferax sp.]